MSIDNDSFTDYPDFAEYEDDGCPQYTMDEIMLIMGVKYWLEGIVQSILCVIGVATNIFSLVILTRKDMSNNTFNQMLIWLAVVDVVYLLCMFLTSLSDVFEMQVLLIMTPYIIHPFKSISLTASVLMMVSLASERYVAVYFPFSRMRSSTGNDSGGELRKRLRIHLLPVITASVLFNINKFLECKVVYNEKKGEYGIDITDLRVNQTYLEVYTWTRLFIMGIIPPLAVTYLNYKIYTAVRLARKTRLRMTAMQTVQIRRPDQNGVTHRQQKNDEHLSLTLVCIVLVFLFCNISRCILTVHDVLILDVLRTCMDVGKIGHGYPIWNMILGYISHILLVLNPSLNCAVYCLVGKKFRTASSRCLYKVAPCFKRSSYPRDNVISRVEGGVQACVYSYNNSRRGTTNIVQDNNLSSNVTQSGSLNSSERRKVVFRETSPRNVLDANRMSINGAASVLSVQVKGMHENERTITINPEDQIMMGTIIDWNSITSNHK